MIRGNSPDRATRPGDDAQTEPPGDTSAHPPGDPRADPHSAAHGVARADSLAIRQLAALSNPQRLRIIAALHRHGRQYVSELARMVGLSRPLLYLHLDKLHAAGLVSSELGLSDDGKALKWFTLTDFEFHITPDRIAHIASTLPDHEENEG